MESKPSPVEVQDQLSALAAVQQAARVEKYPLAEWWQALIIGLLGPIMVGTEALPNLYAVISAVAGLAVFAGLGIREARRPRVRQRKLGFPRPLAIRIGLFVFVLMVAVTAFSNYMERDWSNAEYWLWAVASYVVASAACYLWIEYFNRKVVECVGGAAANTADSAAA